MMDSLSLIHPPIVVVGYLYTALSFITFLLAVLPTTPTFTKNCGTDDTLEHLRNHPVCITYFSLIVESAHVTWTNMVIV